MRIFIEDSFDSAHSLPHLPEGHKCRNLHGHTYKIRIEVSGQLCPINGWVIDYTDLKAVWLPIKSDYDHRNLNDFLFKSTCEALAQLIWDRLKWMLPSSVILERIELRETEKCGVVIDRNAD